MFTWTFTNRIVGICLIVMGLVIYGIEGLLVAMVLSAWFTYLIYAWLVSKYIGFKLLDQLKSLLPSILLTLSSTIVCIVCILFLPCTSFVSAIISSILYICVYVGLSKLFRLDSYYYCLDLINLFANKIFKKNKK